VYQIPAQKWRFERNGRVVVFDQITEKSIYQSFDTEEIANES
jgi:hypothetical protein